MSKKIENASNLYLQGIKEGKIEVVRDYTGDRYTQHSTGVADGAEGFIEFFKGFLARTTDRDIQIIRGIEDGRYVFLHVFQNIDKGTAKWVTTDMFDTDEQSKIVEHWDVIGAYKEANETVSGNDMILGDFELKDLDKTEENKALVRNFLVEVFQNKKHEAIDRYIAEDYIQHNGNVNNGRQAVKDLLASQELSYDFVFHVMGQGDHVVSYSKMTMAGKEWAVFDIFRIENGKIAEHWDNMEEVPPRTEWANTGKF